MKNAEGVLSLYGGAETWKADHDTVMAAYRMEEVAALGVMAYQFLSGVDAAWQEHVAAGQIAYDEGDDQRIGRLYGLWVETTERYLVPIDRIIQAGLEVKGSDHLRLLLEEARAILESRVLEANIRPIDELLPLARGNPRPECYGR